MNSNDPLLLFHPLPDACVAFSTTRRGGVSKGNYGGFNISSTCGDDPLHVRQNRAALCAKLGVPPERLLLPQQTHEDKCLRIDAGFFSLPPERRRELLQGVDALYTAEPGVCVGVSTADCVPLLLYTSDSPCVAAVHAGWRGTVMRITEKVAGTLIREGHSPGSLWGVIGPSISQAAFEVGDEVYGAFMRAGFPADIARRMPGADGLEHWHIDLWKANVLQLERLGVPLEQIHCSGICTYQHSDHFFSARRLGKDCGRIYNGIMLR